MTHSYATRAWAVTHMSNDFFGLQTIARAAGVKPRTLQSWFRQETQRAELSIKMPREYERSMGIILLDLYPKEIETIAALTFTNPRGLLQWRLENRTDPLSSDLRQRTFEAVIRLKPLVNKAIKKFGKDKYLSNRNLWPDPNLAYEKTWIELDLLFRYTLVQLFNWRFNMDFDREKARDKNLKPKTIIGPHFMRYTEITSEGQHFPLETFRYTRRTKHLLGLWRSEAIDKAMISDSLLPPDWETKGTLILFGSRKESRLLDEIYEGERIKPGNVVRRAAS